MIIVTGGAGFIGSNIIKTLNEQSISNIIVVDDLKDNTKFMNLVDLNITDYIDKDDFLIRIRMKNSFGNIKAIFHEGACSSTTEWDGKYVMHNNYLYSKELLNYCLHFKIPFLYASSAAIYGNRSSDFIECRQYDKPLNIYGYSKFLFDEYVRHVLPNITSQVTGFRYFNVYGPRENYKGNMASVIFHFNTQINNSKNLKLFKGSEKFKRDFIYVYDVVQANMWFLEKGISGIFNLGTGVAESFLTVATIILNHYGINNNIEYIPLPDKLKGYYQEYTKADLTRLRSVGYDKPFTHLTKGVIEYISWLHCNKLN